MFAWGAAKHMRSAGEPDLVELKETAAEGHNKDSGAFMEVCCCEACTPLLKVLLVHTSESPARPWNIEARFTMHFAGYVLIFALMDKSTKHGYNTHAVSLMHLGC